MPTYDPPPPIPPLTFRWRVAGRFGAMTFAASSPDDFARAALAAVASWDALTGSDEAAGLVLEARSYRRHPYAGLTAGWRVLDDRMPADRARLEERLASPGLAAHLFGEGVLWYAPASLPDPPTPELPPLAGGPVETL